MPPSRDPPRLRRRHLVAVFALVLALAGVVVWLSLDAATQVSEQSRQLTGQHIPELRGIGDLQGVMNRRVRQLYLYYATADPGDHRPFASLRAAFARELGRLRTLDPGRAGLEALGGRVAGFEAAVRAFHGEMSRGPERDWDRLRAHLARAQGEAEAVDRVLSEWREDIRARAGAGARRTLEEVQRMRRLQLGFSAGVSVLAAFVLVTWYKRFRDHAALHHQAYHERLTGLPNRRRLEVDWGAARGAPGQPEALLLVGLDRFQLVTGAYGYLVGDQLVVAVSRWLEEVLRERAVAGGLYYLQPGVWLVRARGADPAAVAALGARILALSGAPVCLGEREVNTSCSIGVTWCPDQGADIDALLRNADAALRQAARGGGHCVRVYDPDMGARDRRGAAIEGALRGALERDELVLHFQPQVEAASGLPRGGEVLVRWCREGRLVSPGEFIPVAEQSALIIPLGEWILGAACRQWAAWRAQGHPALPLAVNVSAQQFHRAEFPDQVQAALEAAAMPPGMLELEITEAAAADQPEQVLATMERLKAIGVTLAVDDFGTGHSALAYLQRFPMDVLKVDRSFVRHLEHSRQDRAIVELLLHLARELGLTVVAEGVESEGQRAWLAERGCQVLQGYLYSPPLAGADYLAFLAAAGQGPGASGGALG